MSGCLKSRTLEAYPELSKSIRYERALLYETLGRQAMARKDFERIYAVDPSFMEVRAKLGMSAAADRTGTATTPSAPAGC